MKCRKCGDEHFYLQQEGNLHIGAYCNNCNAWITWISKKDLPKAEKYAERFNKSLDLNIQTSNAKINVVQGVIPPPASQDPKGPQGPRGLLPSSATAEQFLDELNYWSGEAQRILKEMYTVCENYNYYTNLLKEKLKGNEDDTPPWD